MTSWHSQPLHSNWTADPVLLQWQEGRDVAGHPAGKHG